MGFPKFSFDKDIEELASFSRALSLPVRVAILKILIDKGDWITNENFSELPLTIVTRDRHLRALLDLDIIEKIHTKGTVYYRLNNANFARLVKGFKSLFHLFDDSQKALPK